MTKIFKMVLVGAMFVGLLVAPLGLARADEIAHGGANGTSFEWTIPTLTVPGVNAPKLEVELNGEKTTVGAENAIPGTVIGGVLKVAFRASDWAVSDATAECLPGQIGKGLTMTGKSPSATLQASYTPIAGEAQSFAPSADSRYPTASFSLCV